jgi:hypothetical protein
MFKFGKLLWRRALLFYSWFQMFKLSMNEINPGQDVILLSHFQSFATWKSHESIQNVVKGESLKSSSTFTKADAFFKVDIIFS